MSQSVGKKETTNQQGISRWKSLSLHCPLDDEIVILKRILKVEQSKNNTFQFPVFECPRCRQLYTHINGQENQKKYRINDVVYTNIEPSKHNVQKNGKKNKKVKKNIEKGSMVVNMPCMTYPDVPPHYCANNGCKGKISQRYMRIHGSNRFYTSIRTHYCSVCGLIYLKKSVFNDNKDHFRLVGEIESHKQEKHEPVKAPKKETEIWSQKVSTTLDYDKYQTIEIRDFVIRQNTFRCYYKKHQIQEVDAVINIMKSNGDLYEMLIPAGYCPQCKTYFIMESTFQKVIKYGIPACRVCDEKTYIQSYQRFRGENLAAESIIKQYGYTVNQQENLTTEQRHRILELIVDNGICSKKQIISLLDYHIRMRSNQNTHKYDLAISKWESDRDYIDLYRVGSNKRVRVKSIRKSY